MPYFLNLHAALEPCTKAIFLISMIAVAYTWLLYPLLLCLLNRLARRRGITRECWPVFSIIIAAHNEESQIAAKLENCLALRYPWDAGGNVEIPGIEIVVASDGSTDSTKATVEQWAAGDGRIRLLEAEGRAGKSGAQNLAAACARGEILLFTDAGTRMEPDLLERIAPRFADPQVGAVAPVVQFAKGDCAVSSGQGAYWRYEIFLREQESRLGILATLSGAAFAVRRELFRPIPANFGDDCIVPLDVRLQGYRIVQDADAIVYDEMPHTPAAELRARVRMTARNWSGILARPALLNPLQFPGTAWGLISHKLLRWLTPFFLATALFANAMLVLGGRLSFLVFLFFLQSCFYAAAAVGWKRSGRDSSSRIVGYPFAFCLANAGFLLGIVRSARGRTIVAYK
jgi:cellulose synthase/poly-beta-1,6-N-acetylglucosamine synthase-like glycosyltransferase